MGRIEKADEEKIKMFIAALMKNKTEDIYSRNGSPSPNKIRDLIQERLGIITTRQTIYNYLKNETYTQYVKDINVSGNKDIVDISNMIIKAEEIINGEETKAGDKTKALNSWRQLKQQLLDHEQHLRDLELREIEAKKPIYLIQFNPANAERICPKCGYKFYDLDKKEDSKWNLKSGDGQSTIDECVDNGKKKDKDKNNENIEASSTS